MTQPQKATKLPTLFVAHGAPPLLDDAKWVSELHTWAEGLPRPNSILMISAHWENRPLTLGATRTVPLVYDFYGFPKRYYEQQYAAPGAPALAERIRKELGGIMPIADEPERGLDHGAYVPLVAMYPEADIPVLQMSLPTQEPEAAVRARPLAACAARRGRSDHRQRLHHAQPACDRLVE